jgi:hypothetical protein
MKIAVTGGRDHLPTRAEIQVFLRLWRELGGTELHHGDARGVDRYMAAVVKNELPGVKIIAHPANWDLYGKLAGHIRNGEMLAQADMLFAFAGGRGTANCVETARHRGMTVHSISTEKESLQKPRPVEPGPSEPLPTTYQPDHPSNGGCLHPKTIWTWWPRWAAWQKSCATCNLKRWATSAETRELEKEVEEHCRDGV